jgi:hypothetical protein
MAVGALHDQDVCVHRNGRLDRSARADAEVAGVEEPPSIRRVDDNLGSAEDVAGWLESDPMARALDRLAERNRREVRAPVPPCDECDSGRAGDPSIMSGDMVAVTVGDEGIAGTPRRVQRKIELWQTDMVAVGEQERTPLAGEIAGRPAEPDDTSRGVALSTRAAIGSFHFPAQAGARPGKRKTP